MEMALFTDCGLIGRLGFQKPNIGLVELFYTYLLPINLKALRTDGQIRLSRQLHLVDVSHLHLQLMENGIIYRLWFDRKTAVFQTPIRGLVELFYTYFQLTATLVVTLRNFEDFAGL